MDSGNTVSYISRYEEIIQLREILVSETDRGCALVAAAYLDEQLASLLRGFFIDDTKLAGKLIEGNGPLGSFSARIDLSHSLGLIPKLAVRDLHLIRKIRNDFAHIAAPLTFDDPAIASRCAQLRHDVFRQQLPPRHKFIRVATGVAAFIHAAMVTEPKRLPQGDIDLDSPAVANAIELESQAIKLILSKLLSTANQ
jgi:DNA-binding MltR family transcriptional regulator